MHKWAQPVKLWYYAPMFRYERPQAGRYREHYQLGAEAIGSSDPMVDVEVIAMLGQLFEEIDLTGLRLAMNSMGDAACRLVYVERLRAYLTEHEGELCGDCRERLALNPLRTFDCKQPACRAVLDRAPRITDHLCADCRDHFQRVLTLLRRLGLEPELDFRLVRGLDYYTRTTFEYQAAALDAAQNTVGGGGRYDGLVEEIGGPPTAGVGFGAGLERMALAIGGEQGQAAGLDVYVVCLDEGRRDDALVIAETLRRRLLLEVDLDLAARSVKGQLKQAGSREARHAVLVGLAGLPAEVVRVRTMHTGQEEDVRVDGLGEWLAAHAEGS
jgi:histidyl-tRNA synthetase